MTEVERERERAPGNDYCVFGGPCNLARSERTTLTLLPHLSLSLSEIKRCHLKEAAANAAAIRDL